MARATKEEAQETRKRILDAAEDVFYEQGVARTSLADLAGVAGVTRGAIYWHFKNKIDVFDAMCERVRLPMAQMVQASADSCADDPLGQLRATCLFVLHEAASNLHARKVFGILFHRCEYSDAAQEFVTLQQDILNTGARNIELTLKNAIARGQLPADLDARLAAILFQASWRGLLSNWLISPGSFDLGKDAEKFVDACMDILRLAPSLRRSGRI
ncbi:TetR family transcriptional regulator [Janthinobacterium sp. 17J80-10]|uniref:TetR family transcriptional regulator n=1 Tax=Janthinobacterium sp. 17J80-10 TaxID=2497863 RepID=UPI0010056825|nr:TetR family transcriptional regulator [Janthinobacterium sp. 17J80-10]QAU33559.1 TetR family transcriptional regulator [Janthinobacterium sp. 17J80-10]